MITTKEVPLDSITLREEFSRLITDSDKHTELVQSIKAQGILYPLIVMEIEGGLTLIAGYRRYRAAQDIGLPTVPCICLKVGIDDAEILRLHENLYREDISPLAEAEAMDRLERTYHFTRSKIAQLLGKSPSYVTQRLSILQWSPELRSALGTAKITFSVARELSAVTEADPMHSMLEQIVSAGASVRTVAGWVQQWKADIVAAADKQSVVESTDEKKPTSDEPTSCYFCAKYIDRAVARRIIVCLECLDKIDDTEGSQP